MRQSEKSADSNRLERRASIAPQMPHNIGVLMVCERVVP